MEEKKDTSAVDETQEEQAETDQIDQTDQDEPEIEIIEPENNNESSEASQDDQTLVDQLKTDLEQLKQEKDEYYNKMLRVQAEYDNFKKRTQKEKQAERKYRAQDVVTELLPAIDNFERALQVEVPEEAASFVEGMKMVHNQINTALESQGIVKIDTVGKEFDPNIHHAVMQVEDEEYDSNIVVEELQTGYMLEDRVIRPAMVKVNK